MSYIVNQVQSQLRECVMAAITKACEKSDAVEGKNE